MSNGRDTILVAGATGQQGGAVAARLIADGWSVRALTRNPSGTAAQALRHSGAEVVGGDLGDRASLDAALRGAYGAFSVQPPGFDGSEVGTAEEIRFGTGFADAAKASGVRHFVYASVGGADRKPGVPHFETKWAIEQHIRALGLPATILRPVTFMELLLSSYVAFRGDGFSFIPAPDTPVQHIAVEDIGVFAALAFGRPAEFAGKALEIAGDTVTMAQAAAAIGAATGRRLVYAPFPPEVVDANPVSAALRAFLERKGFAADIPSLRKLHPGLLTFEAWLAASGRRRFAALFSSQTA